MQGAFQFIEHRELLARLRALSKAIREECEYVNKGGCGVVAGEVGRHLQTLGVPVEVITPAGYEYGAASPAQARANLGRWGIDPESAAPYDWDEADLYRSHLAVRFISEGRKYTWDSEGLVQGGRRFGYLGRCEFTGRKLYWHTADYPFGQGLTPQEAAGMSEHEDGWNSTFDRDQIPDIIELAAFHLLGAHHAKR